MAAFALRDVVAVLLYNLLTRPVGAYPVRVALAEVFVCRAPVAGGVIAPYVDVVWGVNPFTLPAVDYFAIHFT